MNIKGHRISLLLGCILMGSFSECLAQTYYLAPTGSDSASGSQSAPWKTFARAQQTLTGGDRLWIRGGKYTFTAGLNSCSSQTDTVNAITLNKSGSSGSRIEYMAYTGETPVFDFSKMTDDCRVKGFNVVADWITLKGLEITGVPQHNNKNHESWGVWIKGSHNIFEQLNIHHIMGTGLFLQNGAYNTILNSDSHHNYDPLTSNGAGQSADGFGAHISANMPGNIFSGCRAWWNSDDGFDLINAYSSVIIENSWAWLHGYLPGTTTSLAAGNGNGFKIGGYGGVYVSNAAKHTVRNSVAFLNKAAGFYTNHHPLANDYFNNTGYKNHPNFNLLGIDSSGNGVALGTLRNNIAYGGTALSNSSGANMRYNSWNFSNVLSDAEFRSVSTSGWDAARQSDGSLPELKSLHLASGSWMIDKGGNVKLPYKGSAPDLGAFERE
nr:pectate lyase PelN [Brenneria ulupoensis]